MRVDASNGVSSTYKSQPIEAQKACIDRFEKTESGKTLAVLLVGDQEKVMNVPLDQLPAGVKEGDWLKVEIKGDKLVSAAADPQETETRRQEIQDLFESVVEQPKTVSTKACIDRFEKCEDGRTLAVVLVGDDEKVVNVPIENLPAGVKEGDWLKVEMQGDKITSAQVDKKETEDRRNWIQKLFDMLFG
jgi:hypothetical protein